MADKKAESDSEDEKTIENDLVVTKYKMAGEITNKVLELVMQECVAGAVVLKLCERGDRQLMDETGRVFKKDKEMIKGIAFPTCISVNNCVCHFSPLPSDREVVLKDGDVVKIDLGCHVDGFIAVVAHTMVVGASKDNPVVGRRADCLLAAWQCAQAALRLVRPGQSNYAVTDAVAKIAAAYNCKPIEGMLSHQLKQNTIDGDKSIIQNPSEAQRKEHDKCEFSEYEVYAVDCLLSTGTEGKARENGDSRTTVYKKTDDVYQLKLKASRAFLSEVEKRFHTMPFTLRMLDDEKKAKLGITECERHHLLEPYQVLYDREGEVVCQFKFTVLLMPQWPHKITGATGAPWADPTLVATSQCQVEDEDIKKLLSTSISKGAAKKKQKKKKKAGGGGGGEGEGAGEGDEAAAAAAAVASPSPAAAAAAAAGGEEVKVPPAPAPQAAAVEA